MIVLLVVGWLASIIGWLHVIITILILISSTHYPAPPIIQSHPAHYIARCIQGRTIVSNLLCSCHSYHLYTGLSLPNIGSISLGSSLNSSLNSTLGGSYNDPLAAASYSPTMPPQQYNGSAPAPFSPGGYMFGVPQLSQQIAQQLPQKEGQICHYVAIIK